MYRCPACRCSATTTRRNRWPSCRGRARCSAMRRASRSCSMTPRSPSTRKCSCGSSRTTRSRRIPLFIETRDLRRLATVEIFYSVVRFFTAGGVFMLPILAVGAVGVAIALERYITITRMRVKNRALWAQVEPAITSGDFDKAREITGKDETALARLLGTGLEVQGAVRRRDDVKEAMQESMMEILPQLEKRTHYLATFANLATLLGLLGTVSGLIHAFSAVSTANPAEKANLLSASISEAMNCTAFGLKVAVSFLFIYAFLQTKSSQLIDGLETAAIKFLNALPRRATAKVLAARIEPARAAYGA